MPVPLAPQPTNVKVDTSNANGTIKKKQPPPIVNHDIKSKKEMSQHLKLPPDPEVTTQLHPQSQMKKITRRSSKPIINWFQRKLAGTVRARRASEADGIRTQRLGSRSPSLQEKKRRSSAPMPSPLTTRTKSNTGSKHGPKTVPAGTSPPRNTISLDGVSGATNTTDDATEWDDERRSSLAQDSMWSPTSIYEADEDASVRPLPPSSPPSPSPSRSSSSYMSDPRTFRSMTASTKPTTLLSIDLTGGMAHIAQAPPTPTTPSHRRPTHIRTRSIGPGSGGSITFSGIGTPSPTTPSRPSSGNSINMPFRSSVHPHTLQAPQHTTHHPRNNPRPSSPPQDNASVLTLASSAFAMPGMRIGVGTLALSGRGSLADESVSHYSHVMGQGDSVSHFLLGTDELEGERERDVDVDHDVDASVRALRPRSSRRCSWESEASGWSASASLALTGMTGATSPIGFGGQKERSLWTTGSYRTGERSMDNDEEDTEGAEESSEDGQAHGLARYSSEEMSVSPAQSSAVDSSVPLESPVSNETAEPHTPPATASEGISYLGTKEPSLDSHANGSITPSKSISATPKGTSVPLQDVALMPQPSRTVSRESEESVASGERTDVNLIYYASTQSLATTDYNTDAYHTASSTPIPP
ncbi:hypothetical protein AcV5_000870 [Taiwanofungus camphoratus]|nr:hypothetical protein AcW2_006507 [Antrodia cinnamomea]KAI0939450.1 hypothetical protein AcV5_000870 [Antrodia cinnamomea]KAI0952368.1 hypothetical protein AcV7_008204 [Antrodia cinnamomea]